MILFQMKRMEFIESQISIKKTREVESGLETKNNKVMKIENKNYYNFMNKGFWV